MVKMVLSPNIKFFRDLSKLTTTNDYVLIYYSGHGLTKAYKHIGYQKTVDLEWDLH